MSTGSCDGTISVGGAPVPVHVRRFARSRNYRLTIEPASGLIRLSIPARANLGKAIVWAQGQEAWIAEQMARRQPVARLEPGARFPLEGCDMLLEWLPDAPRRIVRTADRLILGGAAESAGPRAVRWMKALARDVLTAETRELASRHNLPLKSVSIGDPRSRWGSCSSSGAIRYSWRLILCPPDVRRATIAHESAHLLHMDHSPAFHAAHARLLGADPRPARLWLREHGARLHAITA